MLSEAEPCCHSVSHHEASLIVRAVHSVIQYLGPMSYDQGPAFPPAVGSGKALAHIHAVCDVGLIHRDVKPVTPAAVKHAAIRVPIPSFLLSEGLGIREGVVPERVNCSFAFHDFASSLDRAAEEA